jgi:hypothetical protein
MIGVCLGVTGMLGLTGSLALCEWTSSKGAIYLSTFLCTIVLTLALKKAQYDAVGRGDTRSILSGASGWAGENARDLL